MGNTTSTASVRTLPDVFAFIKVGQREHMEEFRNAGLLHMNTLRYFLKLEDPLRGDPYEGTAVLLQPSRLKRIAVADHEIRPADVLEIRLHADEALDCHLFCLHALTSERAELMLDGAPAVDERNFGFGTHAVVIKDVKEFMRRVERVVTGDKLGLTGKLVAYDDYRKRHGDVGFFVKPDKFAYQSEYRIVVPPSGGEVFRLVLGSLEDISDIYPVAELNRVITVEVEPLTPTGS